MKQIAKMLGVSPGSVHKWTKDIELSDQQREQICEEKLAGQYKPRQCVRCERFFVCTVEINGKIRRLHRRDMCLECKPLGRTGQPMRNGEYLLMVAPEDFPGLKYRGRYCYEHTLVYWRNTGIVPGPGECIHHKNEKKHDNRFKNLELKNKGEHVRDHSLERGRIVLELRCPSCHEVFERDRRQTHLGKRSKRTFCSRQCSGRGPVGSVRNVIREFVGYGSGLTNARKDRRLPLQ